MRPKRSAKLDTRTARSRLPVASKPIYVQIGRGLHLGYRKNPSGGRWVMRWGTGRGEYKVEVLADADDLADSNGETVLDFFQAQRAALERRKAHFLETSRNPDHYSVTKCLADYFTTLDARGSKTLLDAKGRAAKHIVPFLGDRLVATLTPDELRKWLLNLSRSAPCRRGTKPQKQGIDLSDPEVLRRRKASANRTFTILKAALNHAFEEGHVATDAAWRKVRPFREVDAARTRYLSLEEIALLLRHSNDAFGTLIRAALHTGARYGELVRLTVADFDVRSQTLRIRQSKSGKARALHLTKEASWFFDGLCKGRGSGERILQREDGNAWGASHQVRRMKELRSCAGLTDDVSFHELRHTYASHAAMNGMPIKVLADNLGHADTRMVEKHYGHLSDTYRKTVIQSTALRF